MALPSFFGQDCKLGECRVQPVSKESLAKYVKDKAERLLEQQFCKTDGILAKCQPSSNASSWFNKTISDTEFLLVFFRIGKGEEKRSFFIDTLGNVWNVNFPRASLQWYQDAIFLCFKDEKSFKIVDLLSFIKKPMNDLQWRMIACHLLSLQTNLQVVPRTKLPKQMNQSDLCYGQNGTTFCILSESDEYSL